GRGQRRLREQDRRYRRPHRARHIRERPSHGIRGGRRPAAARVGAGRRRRRRARGTPRRARRPARGGPREGPLVQRSTPRRAADVSGLPSPVDVREVGPRDGLQAEAPVDVATRVAMIESLLDAGVTHIEVAAFVSPRAVPAMAGAGDVLASVPRRAGVVYAALVPNVKGAELALGAGVDELTVTVSASETYSRRNVRMSVEESIVAAADICVVAGEVPADVIVSCAFGSPYEGDIAPDEVTALGRRLAEQGAARVTYADTTGMGTPRRIDEIGRAHV